MTRAVRLFVLVCVVAFAGCSLAVTDGSIATDTPTATATPAGGAAGTPGSTPDLSFQPEETVRVTVTAVVDGDTVDVRMPDGSEDTVRLVGVDTPEVHVENDPAEFEGVPDTEAGRACLREAGHNASTYTAARLADETVTLAFDPNTDRRGGYGRLLAYVLVDDTNVNYALVESGHARLYDTDFALRAEFEAAETRAREAGRGLWTCRDP